MVAPVDAVREVASEVPDPEIPMVTVGDLGMVREVVEEDTKVVVKVSPTYSGCPATEVIQRSIAAAIEEAGLGQVEVRMVKSPPWTTDWITERGRKRLSEAGIAPPSGQLVKIGQLGPSLFAPPPTVACPLCGSLSTERVSAHGSTPCKAMYRCRACGEPFEYFKCH